VIARKGRGVLRNPGPDDRLDAAALARAGRYDEALAGFENAHRVFSDLGLSENVDRTPVGLVQARSKLGARSSDSDLDEYESAVRRLTPSESAAMRLNLANIAHNHGDDARADRFYATFADRARAMNMPVDAARFDSSYSVVLRAARGDVDAATSTAVVDRDLRW
jgi:hypothetical protein